MNINTATKVTLLSSLAETDGAHGSHSDADYAAMTLKSLRAACRALIADGVTLADPTPAAPVSPDTVTVDAVETVVPEPETLPAVVVDVLPGLAFTSTGDADLDGRIVQVGQHGRSLTLVTASVVRDLFAGDHIGKGKSFPRQGDLASYLDVSAGRLTGLKRIGAFVTAHPESVTAPWFGRFNSKAGTKDVGALFTAVGEDGKAVETVPTVDALTTVLDRLYGPKSMAPAGATPTNNPGEGDAGTAGEGGDTGGDKREARQGVDTFVMPRSTSGVLDALEQITARLSVTKMSPAEFSRFADIAASLEEITGHGTATPSAVAS